MASEPDPGRVQLLRRGETLEAISVGYNVLEGLIAIGAGINAGSAALSGFGVDSLIEVTSALVVWRRLRAERSGGTLARARSIERNAARTAGALLLLLATALTAESARQLSTGSRPSASPVGMVLTALSLGIMPILARAKLRLSARVGSRALRADAHEAIACAWMSGTTLAGLVLNDARGWWWADPVAAVLMVPLIAREGWESIRGQEPARVAGD